jgi:RNA polymerase sigma-70 factor, ECF subfamily
LTFNCIAATSYGMNKDKENILISRAQNGDKEALGELWDDITPKLFGYLINTLSRKEIAEDILQSTWLKAVKSIDKYQSRGIGFNAWIFAIAKNECFQYWRGSNREVPLEERNHDLPTNEHNITNNRIMVNQMLASLSENDRELIKLRYIGGLTIGEISKVLDINYIAARVRIHRALKKAREIFNKQIWKIINYTIYLQNGEGKIESFLKIAIK